VSSNNRRILIVDDNRAIHDDFRKILGGAAGGEIDKLEADLFGGAPPAVSFELTSAYQGEDGVALVQRARASNVPFAMAIVDMRMPPGIDGVQTISRMWEVDPDLQIVICTAYSDASWTEIVSRLGTTDQLLILKKPFDLVEVCQLALALTEKWKLAREARIRMAQLVRSRADLTASLALAHAVREATEDGLLVVGADRKVVAANNRFAEMWRIPRDIFAAGDDNRLLGYVLDQLADPEEFVGRVQYLYEHVDETASEEIRLKDGRVFERWTSPVRSDFDEIHGRLWCFRDVTERRKLEVDRAVVTERMASMGRLAAGIGHEINNPLTYALGNVETALTLCEATSSPPTPEVVAALKDACDGLLRIRVIVRDLQSLSRAEEAHRDVDLAEVVERALQIAGAEVRHRAPIVRRYEPVPLVAGDQVRLGQVFLNLIVNAAHSIPEGAVGTNRIEIAIRTTDTHSIVEVTDTGTGIAAHDLERIFDPFFTTKPIGRGTGLGLSISREIVARHDGSLTVASTLGVGTRMTVSLPHSKAAAEQTIATTTATVPSVDQRAKILVIDDEPQIARTLQRLLAAANDVVIAPSARDALDRIGRGETFDLILCDLMMPDINGIDVYDHLTREHPDLVSRIVYMTGGAFSPRAKQFLATIANEHIYKPFSLAEIRRVVARHLER